MNFRIRARTTGRLQRLGPMAMLTALALATIVTFPLHAAEPAAAPPAQVKTIVELLNQPDVRAWLEQQMGTKAADTPATTVPPSTTPVLDEEQRLEADESGIEHAVNQAAEQLREHRELVVEALPRLPGEVSAAVGRLDDEVSHLGLFAMAPLIILFVGAGLVAEWAFLRATRKLRRRVLDASEATVGARIRKIGLRFALALLSVVIFAAASLGAFLVFDWQPLFRAVAGRYLFAFIILRFGLVVGRFLLAPKLSHLRVVPLDNDSAIFWYRRWVIILAIFAFGWSTAADLRALGAPYPMGMLIAYIFGFGMLVVAIETTWRRRGKQYDLAAADGDLSDAPGTLPAIAMTIYFTLLYVLWVLGAMHIFWTLLIAFMLPAAISVTQKAVNNLLRPVGADVTQVEAGPPSIVAAVIERGARAILIVGAAYLLAWAWEVDFSAMARGEGSMGQLAGGLINVVVIALLADFGWHVAKTAIDANLHPRAGEENDTEEEIRRRMRLRTLLPIFRNLLFIMVLVTAALMGLAALGVQIGPLLAGAGVIGVAVGFGAQTLVKDVISGMFYLLDDAFRVGEYVVSGSYKGTVEAFSLRSVKLRHHRGPLYTVPFGSLGAIQNMSRDWVIDKVLIGVTYDTDLDKVKRVIKQVSKELMADPEIAHDILEPLKMQGVNAMGDFAIQIALKMMCKPGHQFVVRRRAFALIKKAFEANDIHFAFPTVTVSGGASDADVSSAVAQKAIDMTKAPVPAT